MSTRCAVYSRFSCDRQSPDSIEDQVRKCRQFAESHGWQISEKHIYADEALSGATADRPALQRLLAATSDRPLPFDCVLFDDTSRLARKLPDSLNLSEQLRFAGVRLIFVSQGIDSESEQADVLLATHGIVDSLYIRELGKKVRRGVEGRVLKRLHHGGHIFGYRSVPIEDPTRRDNYGRPIVSGVRLAVDADEAAIVQRIFALYANGHSLKRIAKLLNAEGVRSPRPRKGRQQSWCPSSLRWILRNERYRGVVSWGRTKKIRDPRTGKRRDRPVFEWLRVEMPEQRIVSDQLWARVQEQRELVNRLYGDQGRKGGLLRARAASSRYIFSGLLKCGVCGANFTIVSGCGRNHKSADYGCPMHAFRGTCSNSRRIPREVLEQELLAKLQKDVLSDAAAEYILRRFEEEIRKTENLKDAEIEQMRRRKARLEGELGNLVRSIASGFDSPTLRDEIRREREISEMCERPRRSPQETRDLRRFVLAGLSDLRTLLNGNVGSPFATRAELARHIEAITLEPDDEGGTVRYRGTWDLLGCTERFCPSAPPTRRNASPKKSTEPTAESASSHCRKRALTGAMACRLSTLSALPIGFRS